MLPVADEDKQLRAAEDDLRRQFPSVPTETVHAVCERVLRGFDGAKIRSFVPLLVQREARGQLGRLDLIS
jgi:hypothetical protein